MTIVWLVVAVIGCLVVQAFFAASEIALVSADDLKVRAEQRRRSRTLASARQIADQSRSSAGAHSHRHQCRDCDRGGRAHQLSASDQAAPGLSRAVYSDADHAGAGRVDTETADAHESALVRAVRGAPAAFARDCPRAAALPRDSAEQDAAPAGGRAGRRRERVPQSRRFGAPDAATSDRRIGRRRTTQSCPPSSR